MLNDKRYENVKIKRVTWNWNHYDHNDTYQNRKKQLCDSICSDFTRHPLYNKHNIEEFEYFKMSLITSIESVNINPYDIFECYDVMESFITKYDAFRAGNLVELHNVHDSFFMNLEVDITMYVYRLIDRRVIECNIPKLYKKIIKRYEKQLSKYVNWYIKLQYVNFIKNIKRIC